MKKNSKNKSAKASVAKGNKKNAKTVTVSAAAVAAVNTETPTKRGVGRPRTKFVKPVAFVMKDGAYTRRTKGKPSPKVEVRYFNVPWNYTGSTLPEGSEQVSAPVKKVKAAVAA